MARTLWSVYKLIDSVWTLSTDRFVVPNESMERTKTGTIIQAKLADGSNAYASPETKYNYEPFTMIFLAIEEGDEFITNINSYVDNATLLKIVDHNGNAMIGIFTAVTEVWLSGMEDCYDYQATFLRIA